MLPDRRPGFLAYAPPAAAYAAGVAIAPNVPIWTGYATSFAVSPALPAGFSLHPATGIVSGTPATSSPATSYQVTATGPLGSTTRLLTIILN